MMAKILPDTSLFQQTVIPSEQDINLGFERPYITLNNETRSVYGGVERVTLDDRSLCLCVSVDAAEILGCERQILVSVQTIANSKLGEIASCLRAMFAAEFVDRRTAPQP